MARLPYHDHTQRNYVPIKQDPAWQNFASADLAYNRTIKMNDQFAWSVDSPHHFFHERAITQTSRTVLFADGQSEDIFKNDGNLVTSHLSTNNTAFDWSPGVVGLRHHGAANVAFVDGHVAAIKNPIRYDYSRPCWFADQTAADLGSIIWKFHG